jgi:hypothetical protein
MLRKASLKILEARRARRRWAATHALLVFRGQPCERLLDAASWHLHQHHLRDEQADGPHDPSIAAAEAPSLPGSLSEAALMPSRARGGGEKRA